MLDWLWHRRPDRRTDRRKRGDRGEKLAEKLLKRQGHRILARNVRFPRGELDLVALDKASGAVVFVEVRARTARPGGPAPDPAGTVTLRKRRRVLRAAQTFLKQRKVGFDRPLRFDVVAVTFGSEGPPEVKHIRAAFDADGA